MYAFLPSSYSISAILALRFGSYSMPSTSARPLRSLPKSTIRYRRLCPPPRRRTVILPRLFLPAFFLSGANSDFSGLRLVMSEKSSTMLLRRPGDVGFSSLSGMAVRGGLYGT